MITRGACVRMLVRVVECVCYEKKLTGSECVDVCMFTVLSLWNLKSGFCFNIFIYIVCRGKKKGLERRNKENDALFDSV